MHRIIHFAKKYTLFTGALVASATALIFDVSGSHTIAHWILGIAASLELIPLVWGMVQDLRIGTYGVDLLAVTAIGTSVIMHEYWAAIVIVLMLTGGESLEDYAEQRASRELDALLDRAPQKAHILKGRTEVDVPVSQVRVGDKIAIRPGEIVPVDAIILEGTASFDESSITGESLPQTREPGSDIVSGAINLDGALIVRAAHTSADSQYEQIIKLVQSASKSQTPFVRLADRYSVPFTAVSFAIAAAAWVWSGDSRRFLEVIVVATPCPLILAAPIAVISGMSRAARHGIIMKTGSALERLASARTFAFDKTGTLTQGELTVDSITTFNGHKKSEVLQLAASLEANSNHVLARAIVARAQKDKIKISKAKHVKEIAGNGVSAMIGGHEVIVGRWALLEKNHVVLPKNFTPANVQQTAAHVAINGVLAGVITLKDELRPESTQTLDHLRAMGIENFMMVTGDNAATAKAIAKSVGISEVIAEALPGDKLRAIEAQTLRPVAFVGDGVNDAPVLTASDVGIALGARGSTAASESADVVIMQDDLSRVAFGTEIAKRTFFIAKQSIWVGIGLSVMLMAIFSTGKFKPVYGAAIQEVVDVVVIFNALRAHGGARK
ncbi:MAG: heavy metal translocating P-type ATPase [Candidatus Saccharibacteria bacterium]